MNCKDCKWYRHGSCFRFPPVSVLREGGRQTPVYAETTTDAYCGEFSLMGLDELTINPLQVDLSAIKEE